MITKEEFIKYISSYQEFGKSIERISKAISGSKYGCNLYESDWCEAVGKMLDVFMDSQFTERGVDWICYFLWEDVDDKAAYVKQEGDMFNEEKEVRYPLNTIDELWNFLQSDVKLYFKNV